MGGRGDGGGGPAFNALPSGTNTDRGCGVCGIFLTGSSASPPRLAAHSMALASITYEHSNALARCPQSAVTRRRLLPLTGRFVRVSAATPERLMSRSHFHSHSHSPASSKPRPAHILFPAISRCRPQLIVPSGRCSARHTYTRPASHTHQLSIRLDARTDLFRTRSVGEIHSLGFLAALVLDSTRTCACYTTAAVTAAKLPSDKHSAYKSVRVPHPQRTVISNLWMPRAHGLGLGRHWTSPLFAGSRHRSCGCRRLCIDVPVRAWRVET
jgi:hypothetical protein